MRQRTIDKMKADWLAGKSLIVNPKKMSATQKAELEAFFMDEAERRRKHLIYDAFQEYAPRIEEACIQAREDGATDEEAEALMLELLALEFNFAYPVLSLVLDVPSS